MPRSVDDPDSPCVRNCCLDEVDVCLGCGRLLAEILRWHAADADERAGAPPVVVLGYDLWQRRFGADPAVLGQTVLVDREPHTVVGVMPEGFHAIYIDAELWTAFCQELGLSGIGIPESAGGAGLGLVELAIIAL